MTERKIAVFILAIAVTHVISAQPVTGGTNNKLSVELLRSDLELFRTKLESSQPGLYLYTSKDSLRKIFEGIRDAISEPMTSIEFFRKVAPLNKIIRNLHTRLWSSASDENAAETELPRFPLDIYWYKDQMYVLRNHTTDQRVLPGSEINSING